MVRTDHSASTTTLPSPQSMFYSSTEKCVKLKLESSVYQLKITGLSSDFEKDLQNKTSEDWEFAAGKAKELFLGLSDQKYNLFSAQQVQINSTGAKLKIDDSATSLPFIAHRNNTQACYFEIIRRLVMTKKDGIKTSSSSSSSGVSPRSSSPEREISSSERESKKAELKSLTDRYMANQLELASVQSKLRENEFKTSSLQASVASLTVEKDSLQSKLKDAESKNRQLNNEKEAAEISQKSITTELARQKEVAKQLESEILRLKSQPPSSPVPSETQAQKIQALDQDLALAKNKIEELSAKLVQAEANNEKLSKVIEAQKNLIASFQSQLSALKPSDEETQNAIKLAREQSEKEKAHVKSLVEQNQRLKNEIVILQQQLQTSNRVSSEKIASLESQLSNLSSQQQVAQTSLESVKKDLETERKVLQQKYQDVTNIIAKELQGQHQNAQKERQLITQELERLQRAPSLTSSKSPEQKIEAEALEGKKKQIEAFLKEIEGQQKAISVLQQGSDSWPNFMEKIKEILQKNEALQYQLAKAFETRDAALLTVRGTKDLLTIKDTVLAQQSSEIQKQKVKISDLELNLREKENELENLRSKLQVLNSQISHANGQKQIADEKLKKAEENIQTLQASIKKAQESISALEEKLVTDQAKAKEEKRKLRDQNANIIEKLEGQFAEQKVFLAASLKGTEDQIAKISAPSIVTPSDLHSSVDPLLNRKKQIESIQDALTKQEQALRALKSDQEKLPEDELLKKASDLIARNLQLHYMLETVLDKSSNDALLLQHGFIVQLAKVSEEQAKKIEFLSTTIQKDKESASSSQQEFEAIKQALQKEESLKNAALQELEKLKQQIQQQAKTVELLKDEKTKAESALAVLTKNPAETQSFKSQFDEAQKRLNQLVKDLESARNEKEETEKALALANSSFEMHKQSFENQLKGAQKRANQLMQELENARNEKVKAEQTLAESHAKASEEKTKFKGQTASLIGLLDKQIAEQSQFLKQSLNETEELLRKSVPTSSSENGSSTKAKEVLQAQQALTRNFSLRLGQQAELLAALNASKEALSEAVLLERIADLISQNLKLQAELESALQLSASKIHQNVFDQQMKIGELLNTIKAQGSRILILEKTTEKEAQNVQATVKEVERLKESLQNEEKLKKKALEELDSIKNEFFKKESELSRELASSKKMLDQTKQQIEELKKTYDTTLTNLKKEHEQLSKILSSTKDLHEKEKQSLNEQISALRDKMDAIQKAAALRDDVIQQLQRDLVSQTQRANDANQQIARHLEAIGVLEKQVDEKKTLIESKEAQIVSLSRQIGIAQGEIKTLKDSFEQNLKKQIQVNKSNLIELARLENLLTPGSESIRRLAEPSLLSQMQSVSLEQESIMIQQSVDQAFKYFEEVFISAKENLDKVTKEQAKQIVEGSEKLKKVSAEINELKAKLDLLEPEKARLIRENNAIKEEKTKQIRALNKQATVNRDLQIDLDLKKEEINQLKQKISTLEAIKEGTTKEIDILKQKYKLAEDSKLELKEKVDQFQPTIDSMSLEKIELEEALKSAKEQLEDAKRKIERYEAEAKEWDLFASTIGNAKDSYEPIIRLRQEAFNAKKLTERENLFNTIKETYKKTLNFKDAELSFKSLKTFVMAILNSTEGIITSIAEKSGFNDNSQNDNSQVEGILQIGEENLLALYQILERNEATKNWVNDERNTSETHEQIMALLDILDATALRYQEVQKINQDLVTSSESEDEPSNVGNELVENVSAELVEKELFG